MHNPTRALRIPILMGAGLALTLVGCHRSHYRLTYRTETGTALVEARNDEAMGVAYYENGELFGADAVDRMHSANYGSWLRDRDAVDHPRLPEWRRQLRHSKSLASEEETHARELSDSLRDFPFRQGREDLYTIWTSDSPERAGDMLDSASRIRVSRSFADSLCAKALNAEVDDRRAARWMEAFAHKNYREAAARLSTSKVCGDATASAALRNLDGFSSSHRRVIFTSAARRLAGQARHANLIVNSADEMSSREETPALKDVLKGGHAAPKLSIVILRNIDERYSKSRPDLFAATVDLCYRDETAASAIVDAIHKMSSSHRLSAAEYLLAKDSLPPTLVRLLVKRTGRLSLRHREKFLTQLIRSDHYKPEYSADVTRAAKSELSRRPRGRVLKLLENPRGRKTRHFE